MENNKGDVINELKKFIEDVNVEYKKQQEEKKATKIFEDDNTNDKSLYPDTLELIKKFEDSNKRKA